MFGNQPGYQKITNLKSEISQHTSFGFYDWVWHWDEIKKVKQLCQWLGMAANVGPIMAFWILNSKGSPIPHSTVISLLPTEVRIQWRTLTQLLRLRRFNSWNYAIDNIDEQPNDDSIGTRVYNMKFPDGRFERYLSNILGESLTGESIDPQLGMELASSRRSTATALTKVKQ